MEIHRAAKYDAQEIRTIPTSDYIYLDIYFVRIFIFAFKSCTYPTTYT